MSGNQQWLDRWQAHPRELTVGLVTGGLSVFLTLAVTRVLGVLTGALLARALGPSDRGAFAVISLVPSVLALLAGSGIGLANTYYAGKRREQAGDMASNSLILGLVSGTVSILLFAVLLSGFGQTLFKGVEPSYLQLAVCAVPFLLINGYLLSLLRGMDRIREWNLFNVLRGGLWAIVAGAALLVFHAGLVGVVLGNFLVTVIVTLGVLLTVHKEARPRLRLNLTVLRDQLNFGLKGYLASLFQFMNYRLDVFLVNYFVGTAQTGFYVVAVSTAELVWYISRSAETVFFPRVTKASREGANWLTPRVCSTVLMLSAAAALGLLLLAKPIVVLVFGEAYLPSVLPLVLLLPGVLVFAPSGVLTNYIVGAHGLPIVATCKTLVSLLVTILLDLLLIPRYGIAGAAIATTCSYTTNALITLIVFLRLSNTQLRDLFAKPSDVQAMMQVVVRFFRRGEVTG